MVRGLDIIATDRCYSAVRHTQRGRKDIRERLGIKKGDLLEVESMAAGVFFKQIKVVLDIVINR